MPKDDLNSISLLTKKQRKRWGTISVIITLVALCFYSSIKVTSSFDITSFTSSFGVIYALQSQQDESVKNVTPKLMMLQEESTSNCPEALLQRIRRPMKARHPPLPKCPKDRVMKPTDRILVAYSGPTELVNQTLIQSPNATESDRKKELYRVNFEYFLSYGVQCATQDTVLVLTAATQRYYQPRIVAMRAVCDTMGHKLMVLIRQPKCWDMESMRRVLNDDVVDIDWYDYFIYINAGVSGPSKYWAALPWTDLFLEQLQRTKRISMTGLTLNCHTETPHVQSMLVALDRRGVRAIKNSGAVFDCKKLNRNGTNPKDGVDVILTGKAMHQQIVYRYEQGMSKAVLNHGYGITSLLGPRQVLFKSNMTQCRGSDRWMYQLMQKDYGRVPDLKDTVFFKTSRLMSHETKHEINFQPEVNFFFSK